MDKINISFPHHKCRVAKTEAPSYGQFRQHFMSSFCDYYVEKIQIQTVSRKKLLITLFYKKNCLQHFVTIKADDKILMQLTSDVNFTKPSLQMCHYKAFGLKAAIQFHRNKISSNLQLLTMYLKLQPTFSLGTQCHLSQSSVNLLEQKLFIKCW